jgi:hypothetical protein
MGTRGNPYLSSESDAAFTLDMAKTARSAASAQLVRHRVACCSEIIAPAPLRRCRIREKRKRR